MDAFPVACCAGTLLDLLPNDLLPIISRFTSDLQVAISSPISIAEAEWVLKTFEATTMVNDTAGGYATKKWVVKKCRYCPEDDISHNDIRVLTTDDTVVTRLTTVSGCDIDSSLRPQETWFLDVRSIYLILEERLRKVDYQEPNLLPKCVIDQFEANLKLMEYYPIAIDLYLQACVEILTEAEIPSQINFETENLAARRLEYTNIIKQNIS